MLKNGCAWSIKSSEDCESVGLDVTGLYKPTIFLSSCKNATLLVRADNTYINDTSLYNSFSNQPFYLLSNFWSSWYHELQEHVNLNIDLDDTEPLIFW